MPGGGGVIGCTAASTNRLQPIGIFRISNINTPIRSELRKENVKKPIHENSIVAIGREGEKRAIDM